MYKVPESGSVRVVEEEMSSFAQYLWQPVWFHVNVEAEARLNGATRVETTPPENSGSGRVTDRVHDAKLKRQVPRAHAFHPRRATAIPLEGDQLFDEPPDATGLDPDAVVLALESDGTDLHAQPKIPSRLTDTTLHHGYSHPSVDGIRKLKLRLAGSQSSPGLTTLPGVA